MPSVNNAGLFFLSSTSADSAYGARCAYSSSPSSAAKRPSVSSRQARQFPM